MPYCDCLPGKYCGKTLPEPVTASAQSLFIMFHSDELDSFQGFKAEWNTVKNAAHGKRVMLGKNCDLKDFFG